MSPLLWSARSLVGLCFFAGAFVGAAAGDDRNPPVVKTKYGPVQGIWREGGIAAFNKVPYAATTAGKNRWKPAQPPEPWTELVGADEPLGRKGACLQMNPFPDTNTDLNGASGVALGVEDCLFSMIYSPKLPGTDKDDPAPKAPIFFWIHGGAFVIGDAWEEGQQDGLALAQRFGMVVVSVQYRLGFLGFMSLPELADDNPDKTMGNQGLQDQRFALKWLQEHATLFGGDPDRVVIAGESAGGFSVCWHMAAPGSKGLFAGGILESGGCDENLSFDRAKEVGKMFADAGGCKEEGSARLDCLRDKEGMKLMGAAAADPMAAGAAWYIWPTVDGSEAGLPDTQLRLLRAGKGSNVPAIFGHNSNEMQVQCKEGQTPAECDGIQALMSLQDGKARSPTKARTRQSLEFQAPMLGLPFSLTEAQWAKAFKQYPLEDYGNDEAARMSAMWNDLDWETDSGEGGTFNIGQCETLRAANAAVAGGSRIYMYHYDYHTHALGQSKAVVGHGDETPFVFETFTVPGKPKVMKYSEESKAMSLLLGSFWANFVHNLNPNTKVSASSEELPAWPNIEDDGELLRFTGPTSSRAEQPDRAKFCEFWQDLMTEGKGGSADAEEKFQLHSVGGPVASGAPGEFARGRGGSSDRALSALCLLLIAGSSLFGLPFALRRVSQLSWGASWGLAGAGAATGEEEEGSASASRLVAGDQEGETDEERAGGRALA